MKNFRYVLVILIMLLPMLFLSMYSCSKGSNINSNRTPIDLVIMDWAIDLEGYNIVYPPATLALKIMRVNQPENPNAKYKYQLNPDQPWIDVSDQVNTVGFGEVCDIPLNFTEPGKYWITGRIYDGEKWTGLYETFFVIVLPPEK